VQISGIKLADYNGRTNDGPTALQEDTMGKYLPVLPLFFALFFTFKNPWMFSQEEVSARPSTKVSNTLIGQWKVQFMDKMVFMEESGTMEKYVRITHHDPDKIPSCFEEINWQQYEDKNVYDDYDTVGVLSIYGDNTYLYQKYLENKLSKNWCAYPSFNGVYEYDEDDQILESDIFTYKGSQELIKFVDDNTFYHFWINPS
jgi:hypothetical protein